MAIANLVMQCFIHVNNLFRKVVIVMLSLLTGLMLKLYPYHILLEKMVLFGEDIFFMDGDHMVNIHIYI